MNKLIFNCFFFTSLKIFSPTNNCIILSYIKRKLKVMGILFLIQCHLQCARKKSFYTKLKFFFEHFLCHNRNEWLDFISCIATVRKDDEYYQNQKYIGSVNPLKSYLTHSTFLIIHFFFSCDITPLRHF